VVGTVLTATFTHHLPALLRNGDPIPHTVPEALTRAADQQAAIVHAFAGGAQNALQVAGFVTIAAGVLVIAGAVRGARGASGLVTAEAD
jgi:hypothetical protein